MDEILNLIGRKKELFENDLEKYNTTLNELVANASFLVIGGAGSIGQAVAREIFKRKPKKLHIVDISENNLTEAVRDIRSSLGYIEGNFQAFCLDSMDVTFDAMIQHEGPYDYVLNLSALKHVRSEKDPYTLMRLINVNILSTIKTLQQASEMRAQKYFCVSTDKAANPVNMMGASKRIMEMFLLRYGKDIAVSTARFANVAFSDGSLLHGFNQRLYKNQPISAPNDVRRYFVTPKESGELCLLSCLLGENCDIFFPKLSEDLHLINFSEIATRYLSQLGFEAYLCDSEEEARARVKELKIQKKWPCYFFKSDTTGEKDFEEFFMKDEKLDLERFENIGIVKNTYMATDAQLDYFLQEIAKFQKQGHWTKEHLVELFHQLISDFGHKETGKYLDGRM
ncbi:MAG: UDP-N-acetylglucosamine 4,6-dehydratase [Pseudomonadota bacterium]